VEIRPSTAGLPDASIVLASFALAPDNLPLLFSYESAATNLSLQPGTYFALFRAQGSDVGTLLRTATIPFDYHGDTIELGFRELSTGNTFVFTNFASVRILGERDVIIDGCDPGVPDTDLPSGSTLSEAILECAEGATNHGNFVSCVTHATDEAKKAGGITHEQKSAIQSCAVHADIP
jgi:hypothetical protein